MTAQAPESCADSRRIAAPVALFAFNRPDHTQQALTSLTTNPEAAFTTLYFFIDGPREESEISLVEKVAKIGESATGFRNVILRRNKTNLGLFSAITTGVSEVLKSHPSVIVVEDDIVADRWFLAYMNDALEMFRDEPEVGSIHAYAPPLDALPDYFLLEGGDCWGWATWADRWRLFDPEAGRLLSRMFSVKKVKRFCDVQGYRSLLMLAQRALDRNQSWALPWHASLFLEDRLTLHPGRSFVTNIGNDGSGAHAAASKVYDTRVRGTYDGLRRLELSPDRSAANAISRYYDSVGDAGIIAFMRRFGLKVYALLLASYAAARWRYSKGGKVK